MSDDADAARRAVMPRRPLLRWLAGSVAVVVFLMASLLVAVPPSRWQAPVGLVVLACVGAAGLTAAVPLVLIKFFPRAAVATATDVFRPRPRPPSRLIGPAIGWPAFLVGLVLVAVPGWWTWTGWMGSNRTTAGLAFAAWSVHLLRAARPWGHARDRVPSRFPWRRPVG